MKRLLLALTLIGLAPGCAASVRQYVIVADQAFAATVFALDDAEYAACQRQVLTAAQCQALNGPIRKALEDVKAVTLAIKATPKGTIPTSLPRLLQDLDDVQNVIRAFQVVAPELATQAAAANTAAIRLLTQLAGAP